MYALLSDYRISPGNWEYGTPYRDGYQDAAATGTGRRPQDGRRGRVSVLDDAAADRDAAHPGSRTGQSARTPETWASYLTEQVLPFWRAHGWLDRALIWGWDEPGPVYNRQYVAPQACAAHAAGVPYLTTGAPERASPRGGSRSPGGRARAPTRCGRTAPTTSSCGTARAATT